MFRHGLFTAARRRAAETDPNFANVISSLHFDGDLTDVKGKIWTPTGDANANGTAKFGAGALALDGNGDYITGETDASQSFGTGDLTIDVWARENARAAVGGVLFDSLPLNGNGARPNSFVLHGNTDGTLRLFMAGAYRLTSTAALPLGTYEHVRLVRASGVWIIYLGGICRGAVSVALNDALGGFVVGCVANAPALTDFHFNGLLDDLRITKGVARSTGATDGVQYFVPPTAPNPDA